MAGILAGGQYWAKVNAYASGAVEITAVSIPAKRLARAGETIVQVGKPTLCPRPRTPQVVADNRRRAYQRARARLRRLCLAMGADRMMTLTFRENITDENAAFRYLARWLRLLREAGLEFPYVAVAEPQKRGAWHFHLAVHGFQPVTRLRKLWWQVVGEGQGNIDITRPDMRVSAVERCTKISRYIAKYMGKRFEDNEEGRHRFRAAKIIQVPEHKFWLDAENWQECQKETLNVLAASGLPLRGVFFGSDWGCIWAIGWP